MGGLVEATVFLSCITFVIYMYGVITVTSGILDSLLFFLILPSVLYGLNLRFRLPKPKISRVYHILGNEWGSYEKFSGENKYSNDYVMKVVGHRACGLDAPENSLSALKKIHKSGMTAVEFDVVLTADEVPVVFHDDTLTRMTGVPKKVEELTLDEIKTYDISVKHPFGEKFLNERIPTLEEYVTFCISNKIRMFIDLKGKDMRIVEAINKIYKQYPELYDLALITSFNPFVIYKIRSRDPEIVCCLAWRPYFYTHADYNGSPLEPRSTNPFVQGYSYLLNHIHYWLLTHFGYYLLGLSVFFLHKDAVRKSDVLFWAKKNVRLIAWSVNLPSEKQYFERSLEITYLTDTLINS